MEKNELVRQALNGSLMVPVFYNESYEISEEVTRRLIKNLCRIKNGINCEKK